MLGKYLHKHGFWVIFVLYYSVGISVTQTKTFSSISEAHFDDLVQDCSKSIANELELPQSSITPSIFISTDTFLEFRISWFHYQIPDYDTNVLSHLKYSYFTSECMNLYPFPVLPIYQRFKYPLTYDILNLLVAQWRSENMWLFPVALMVAAP